MRNSADRSLFVCNTVYQVLIALWIQHHYLSNDSSDIIVSDHMVGGDRIAERIRETKQFENVYYATTHDFSYRLDGYVQTRQIRKDPYIKIRDYVRIDRVYHKIYIANMDLFAQTLCNAISHLQKNNFEVILFEDGLQTMCKVEERVYQSCVDPVVKGWRGLLSKYYYKDFRLYGNISAAAVFSPELMQWSPGSVIKLDSIDVNDESFIRLVNRVFQYSPSENEYTTKYLFMEERYFGDGELINDVELVEHIADKVGKQNIMIKIHPRNPINRFAKLGYKTNKNLSVPWEVVAMNMNDLSDKVLITIQSGSVSNLIRVLGKRIKAFSLLPLVKAKDREVEFLKGELEKLNWQFFENNRDMITICNSINDVQ